LPLHSPSSANPKFKRIIFINLLNFKIMLQAKFVKTYPSKSGKIKAVYTVTGSPAELDKYKTYQGSYLRFAEDGTTPLIFGDTTLNQDALQKITYTEGIGYFVDFNDVLTAAGATETAQRKGNALIAAEVAKQQVQRLMGTGISTAAASAFDAETPQEPASNAKANLKNPVGS
jgi:hypothetical protein